MSAHRIYFDTNVIHRIAGALQGSTLPDSLRQNIILSPISVLEMLFKLPRDDGGKFFQSIKAMQNWLPNSKTVMDYPLDLMVSAFGINSNSRVHLNIGKVLDALFKSTSFSDFMNEHGEFLLRLKNQRDRDKCLTACGDANFVEAVQEKRYELDDFPAEFVRSSASDHSLQLTPTQEGKIIAKFSAHFEFRTARLQNAVQQADYPFLKQVNDVWDSFQLLYLAYPDLLFVTFEKKFEKQIKTSDQKSRIRRVAETALSNPESVQAFLRTSMFPE